MADQFTFEISLSVLNHLGRNLYRSFTTILGEAISNAWDADAENVYINIDREQNSFVIRDDGIGMSEDDFQKKFLRIGYSKRSSGLSHSNRDRPFIGRKGIGKLALLSAAKKITVVSKTKDGDCTGGTIDNSGLDKAIKNDLTPDKYHLEPLETENLPTYLGQEDQGTMITFENINEGIKNRVEFLRKSIALYFRFSLHDSSFNIFVNGEKVTLDDLSGLAEKTQFLWNINGLEDPYINQSLKGHLKTDQDIQMGEGVKGFIASVKKPGDLRIQNSDVRASIDLFVNGRLRETNILKHIPTARLPANYLYGQVHFDGLDDDKDRFTSSREGIVAEDPKYKNFLLALRKEIGRIIEQWDELRAEYMEDGDPDNLRITRAQRKAEEMYGLVVRKYVPESSINKGSIAGWLLELKGDAAYNFSSYSECFISENLLRKLIEDMEVVPDCCMKDKKQTCFDKYPGIKPEHWCPYCKGKRWISNFQDHKEKARISIQIRQKEDNILMYLDYIDLAKIIGNHILKGEDKPYRPLRNSIMHTSRLTKGAQTRLTAVFDNIVATVQRILKKPF